MIESDAHSSLAALSGCWRDLNDFTVEVDERKLRYLRDQKADNMECAGLLEIMHDDLADILLEKVNQTYIYDLKVNDHGSFLFNSTIERPSAVRRTRMKAGLEYVPAVNKLRLVTMF